MYVRRLLTGIAVLLAVAGAPATAGAATWCGNDVATQDRVPEALSGAQFHVIYADPADGGDRFADFSHRIVTDLENIERWWRANDANRQLRFDLFAFPSGCGSELAPLDLSFVRLARPGSAYAAASTRFQAVRSELAGRGFDDVSMKYLVYYDGPTEANNVCGTGSGDEDQGGASSYAIVWAQAGPSCGTIGAGDYGAKTTAHELLHALGALPRPSGGSGPPHACPGDPGHPCDAVNDVLYSSGFSNTFTDYVLDAGHDDYYAHGGSWFDVQDSRWLRRLDRPEHTLSVALAEAHEGDVVESALPGIRCPTACSIGWEAGTEVELDASAGEESAFVRWEGACTGGDPSCTIRVEGPAIARAVFGPATLPVVLRVRGKGRIAGELACRATCRTSVDYGEPLRLRAVPTKGWRFVRWSGACRGTKACVVVATAPRAVTATFARRRG